MAHMILPALMIGGIGAAGGAIGSMIGSKKAAAPVEAPKPGPVVMPLADGEAARAARRRSMAAQLQRGGRSSTMLTGSNSDRLGG
jgi:hypothetical protein